VVIAPGEIRLFTSRRLAKLANIKILSMEGACTMAREMQELSTFPRPTEAVARI